MMQLVAVDPVVQPRVWNLVFNERPTSWWQGYVVRGRFKHVRAYAYVPGLHVWVFYDPHLSATDIFLAADGQQSVVIAAWMAGGAEIVAMPIRDGGRRWFPAGFWCVPAIKHLLGLRGGALRPDTLRAQCLRNGGVPFEDQHGSAALPAAAP